MEEILDSRRVRKRLQYLVKWTGEVQPTWEPEENMAEVEAVDTFHARYPTRPAPRVWQHALVGTRAYVRAHSEYGGEARRGAAECGGVR